MSATATATAPATGSAKVLATYECDEGTRQLVGQRVDGIVRITDRRTNAGGRAYLVEEGLTWHVGAAGDRRRLPGQGQAPRLRPHAGLVLISSSRCGRHVDLTFRA